jgi:outer membrane protein OmpA-like peptidoglycan-associated protein
MKINKFFLWIASFVFLLSHSQKQQQVIYFESNKHETSETELQRLKEFISNNKDSKVIAINGFTDEDGSNSYNDSLAQRRVAFTLNQLKNKIAIREDFKTRSYGEDFKQSPKKSENRKVTIHYLLAKDIPKENEILEIQSQTNRLKKIPKTYAKNIVIRNPNGTTSEFKTDEAFMQKIDTAKAGERLPIKNLNFVINTFIVVNESRGKLFELLMVLEQNPKLKIEIQGNLCCMANDKTDLSTKRAKAIYGFLTANKIDKSRLSYVGFGSTRPIYTIPEENEQQRAANRRVEILILENE